MDEIERNFCKNVYNNFMSYERILKKLFAFKFRNIWVNFSKNFEEIHWKFKKKFEKFLKLKKKLLDILAEFWILNLTDEIERSFCKNIYHNFMSVEK